MTTLLLLLLAQPTLAAPAPKTAPTNAKKPPASAPAGRAVPLVTQPPKLTPIAPSTKYPAGSRVTGKPKVAPSQTLVPETAAPTTLTLARTGRGKLALQFVARDPKWTLDPKAPLVIQLNTNEGLELEPSVVTRSDWPAGAKSVAIAAKGAAGPVTIKGTYGICHAGPPAKCERVEIRTVVAIAP